MITKWRSLKKCSTPTTPVASLAKSVVLPSGDEFREYLRAEAVRGVWTLLESVMKAELDALIGCGWGESRVERTDYRNGYYQRDLFTSLAFTARLLVQQSASSIKCNTWNSFWHYRKLRLESSQNQCQK